MTHAGLRAEISKIASECQSRGWDGYGADPIDSEREALEFADWLNEHFPRAIDKIIDVVPAPDGSISFEWWVDKKNHVNISVIYYNGGSPRIIALSEFDGHESPAMDGLLRESGTSYFLRDTLKKLQARK